MLFAYPSNVTQPLKSRLLMSKTDVILETVKEKLSRINDAWKVLGTKLAYRKCPIMLVTIITIIAFYL